MRRLKSFIKNTNNTAFLKGLLYLCILIFLIAIPLLMMFVRSFQNNNGVFTFDNWASIGSSKSLEAIKNSLYLGFLVVCFSLLLALPSAFILAKTSLRKFWWIDILLMMVFMIPPYINSQGWISFMQEGGVLYTILSGNKFFYSLSENFFTIYGMAIVMSFHSYPFLLTIVKNAILSIPKEIDDSLAIYCRNPLKKLFQVYFPILLPNIFIGMFLIFVKALAEYGTPATFQTMTNIYVFTTLITNYMSVYPINFGAASSMAYILIFICMTLWMLQSVVSNKFSYKLSGHKSSVSKSKPVALIISIIFLVVLFFISTIIPLGTIILYSLMKTLSGGYHLSNLGFDNYILAFSDKSGFGTGLTALLHTVKIALLSSIFTLVLGYIFEIYSYRNKKKILGRSVENISLLPEMLPNIVLGIGLIMLYASINSPIYKTEWMLILAYTIVFLPNTISYIKGSFSNMSKSILDAGSVFSKNKIMVDIKILIPLTLKNAFYAFMLNFITITRELVVAKLMQPPSYYTLSTYINFQFEQGNTQAAMALSVVSIGLIFLVMLPLEGFIMHEKKKGV